MPTVVRQCETWSARFKGVPSELKSEIVAPAMKAANRTVSSLHGPLPPADPPEPLLPDPSPPPPPPDPPPLFPPPPTRQYAHLDFVHTHRDCICGRCLHASLREACHCKVPRACLHQIWKFCSLVPPLPYSPLPACITQPWLQSCEMHKAGML